MSYFNPYKCIVLSELLRFAVVYQDELVFSLVLSESGSKIIFIVQQRIIGGSYFKLEQCIETI